MRNNAEDLRTLITEQHMVIDGYQFAPTVIKERRVKGVGWQRGEVEAATQTEGEDNLWQVL